MTFCWGRNTSLYQKAAGNLQHKILLLCTHANQLQKQPKLVQQLLNCHITGNGKAGVKHNLQASSDIQALNIDSEERNCHMREKSPTHTLQRPGRSMCVRRCLSRGKHNTRSQKDDAHGDSKEQVTGCV